MIHLVNALCKPPKMIEAKTFAVPEAVKLLHISCHRIDNIGGQEEICSFAQCTLENNSLNWTLLETCTYPVYVLAEELSILMG